MRRPTIPSVGMLALLAALLLRSSVAAQSIKVLAAEFPPLTTNAGGQPSGVVLEVVREAGRRAGIPLEFSFLPWQRAQLETQARNDVLIIPFTRTPGREANYHGPALTVAKSEGERDLRIPTSMDAGCPGASEICAGQIAPRIQAADDAGERVVRVDGIAR